MLNMSIGSSFQWPQYPTAVAASRLVDRGMVVVASIGNSGTSGLYAAGAPGLGEKVIGTASFDNIAVTQGAFTISPDAQGDRLQSRHRFAASTQVGNRSDGADWNETRRCWPDDALRPALPAPGSLDRQNRADPSRDVLLSTSSRTTPRAAGAIAASSCTTMQPAS